MGKDKRPIAVVAIGGNSLILDNSHPFVEDQYKAVCQTVTHITELIKLGYNVVVTHGNGPQVGFIMRRSEIAEEVEHMHPVPLVSCDADTQGAIGYQIQQAFYNEFLAQNIQKTAVTVVTQVEVDAEDPAFTSPSKPIGSFYTPMQYEAIKAMHKDWNMIEDANRGYRRVVASPRPVRIIELDAIKELLSHDHVVIAVGGGGIPVIKNTEGMLEGINAVIDKDHASSLLAKELHADLFIISTAVDYVCIHFGLPDEEVIKKMTVARADELIDAKQFGKGSMLPKIEACIDFVRSTGKNAIITSPAQLGKAVEEKSGTIITP